MLKLSGTTPLKTSRLYLRRFEHNDGEAMLRNWAGDPLIQKMYSEPVYDDIDKVQGLLETYITAYENVDCFRWAIALPDTNECIGQIAYFSVNKDNHFAEIEYCIGRRFQQMGLMTEAVKAVIDFGFEEMNLHKVQVCHKANNLALKRVIEKCKFVYEGTLRDHCYMDGNYVDRLYYSMLREEWLKNGS